MSAPTVSVTTMSAPTVSAPTASPRPVLGSPPLRRPSLGRARVVAPQLRVADSPAAAVLRATVTRGPLARDTVARATGLSIATVNRQVAALIEAGLLRERADLAESGAVGRPRIPIEVAHDPYLTIGIHVGASTTGIVASDLRGRILGGIEIPTPTNGSVAAVRAIARSAVAFADRYRRTPLWVGVALGGRVDAASGIVDHPASRVGVGPGRRGGRRRRRPAGVRVRARRGDGGGRTAARTRRTQRGRQHPLRVRARNRRCRHRFGWQGAHSQRRSGVDRTPAHRIHRRLRLRQAGLPRGDGRGPGCRHTGGGARNRFADNGIDRGGACCRPRRRSRARVARRAGGVSRPHRRDAARPAQPRPGDPRRAGVHGLPCPPCRTSRRHSRRFRRWRAGRFGSVASATGCRPTPRA